MINSGHILLFDGVCNLCNNFVMFVIKRDPGAKIRFVPIQSTVGKELLDKCHMNPNEIDSVVYISGEKHFIKSSAILNLLKDIGGGWRVFFSFIIIPGFIRDFLYDFIAKHRYRFFGKIDSCMVPEGDIKGRFIS